MDAVETAELATETAELPADEEEESTPWYTPGLYLRIGRRGPKKERPPRITIRQRLSARGLHFSGELIVGVFVAVLVSALVAIAFVRVGAGKANDFTSPSQTRSNAASSGGAARGDAAPGGGGGAGVYSGAGGGGPLILPEPTAPCIAAPIPGSPWRPCTY